MTRRVLNTSERNDETTKAITRALRRSARRAREVARMHGTPIYVMKDGKVVALKP
jgi:hypothetical protein